MLQPVHSLMDQPVGYTESSFAFSYYSFLLAVLAEHLTILLTWTRLGIRLRAVQLWTILRFS